jgi:hypothetical protein
MSERFLRRADVLAMLASYGDRQPDEVSEELGSLELTWLVAQVERHYSVLLDLDDETFASMSTVSGALDRLRTALGQPGTADDAAGTDGVAGEVRGG